MVRGGTDSTFRVSADVSLGAPSPAPRLGAPSNAYPGLSAGSALPRGPTRASFALCFPGRQVRIWESALAPAFPSVPIPVAKSWRSLRPSGLEPPSSPPSSARLCPHHLFPGFRRQRLHAPSPPSPHSPGGVSPRLGADQLTPLLTTLNVDDWGHLSPVSLSSLLSPSSYLPSLPFSNPHRLKHFWFF